jgi:hypothetical protein
MPMLGLKLIEVAPAAWRQGPGNLLLRDVEEAGARGGDPAARAVSDGICISIEDFGRWRTNTTGSDITPGRGLPLMRAMSDGDTLRLPGVKWSQVQTLSGRHRSEAVSGEPGGALFHAYPDASPKPAGMDVHGQKVRGLGPATTECRTTA